MIFEGKKKERKKNGHQKLAKKVKEQPCLFFLNIVMNLLTVSSAFDGNWADDAGDVAEVADVDAICDRDGGKKQEEKGRDSRKSLTQN